MDVSSWKNTSNNFHTALRSSSQYQLTNMILAYIFSTVSKNIKGRTISSRAFHLFLIPWKGKYAFTNYYYYNFTFLQANSLHYLQFFSRTRNVQHQQTQLTHATNDLKIAFLLTTFWMYQECWDQDLSLLLLQLHWNRFHFVLLL